MPQKKLSQGIRQSNQITLMLDQVLGSDRFDRGPVDIANLALEYSSHTAPESPIREVLDLDIPGCMGALVYGESKPRQWTIVSHIGQSDGRKAYTLGHEFGHYVLHRKLIDEDERFDGGIWCDESSVLRREGVDIEQEADEFAANLLMPFHDFRRQISAKTVPSFDDLGTIAERYGVSLTAATLRWLEYTETRALLVVSNEGYAHWAKTSKAALKTGHFIKTRNTMYELPASASAVTKDFRQETVDGISQPAGVWFDEPVVEMCISSKRYEQEMTLLHLPRTEPVHHADEIDEDAFDKMSESFRR